MYEAFDNAVDDCDVTYCTITQKEGPQLAQWPGFNERLAAIGCTKMSHCAVTVSPDGTFTINGSM